VALESGDSRQHHQPKIIIDFENGNFAFDKFIVNSASVFVGDKITSLLNDVKAFKSNVQGALSEILGMLPLPQVNAQAQANTLPQVNAQATVSKYFIDRFDFYKLCFNMNEDKTSQVYFNLGNINFLVNDKDKIKGVYQAMLNFAKDDGLMNVKEIREANSTPDILIELNEEDSKIISHTYYLKEYNKNILETDEVSKIQAIRKKYKRIEIERLKGLSIASNTTKLIKETQDTIDILKKNNFIEAKKNTPYNVFLLELNCKLFLKENTDDYIQYINILIHDDDNRPYKYKYKYKFYHDQKEVGTVKLNLGNFIYLKNGCVSGILNGGEYDPSLITDEKNLIKGIQDKSNTLQCINIDIYKNLASQKEQLDFLKKHQQSSPSPSPSPLELISQEVKKET
jgi:hypothetical protein